MVYHLKLNKFDISLGAPRFCMILEILESVAFVDLSLLFKKEEPIEEETQIDSDPHEKSKGESCSSFPELQIESDLITIKPFFPPPDRSYARSSIFGYTGANSFEQSLAVLLLCDRWYSPRRGNIGFPLPNS